MPDKNNIIYNKLISDRYRIIKKIASGGMADVYVGTDLKLNRPVAIKILSENYASNKDFVARFRREAQILAKLNAPNIVAIYDWGEFNGSYFICMEYVEGQSLKEIIEKKGTIDPKIAANYAVQICSALEIAHRNDLIHRDIKPQNILMAPDGVVKVADFGIAKSLDDDITKTINIIGTAHYISPEQAQGEILDCRTDIYSLGIVLYEMLTADVPFRGGSSIDISLKHIGDLPVKPSKLISGIPEKLEKIVMHCLEKNPSKRYLNANELKKDLQNFLDNKPLTIDKDEDKEKYMHGRLPHKKGAGHYYGTASGSQAIKKLKLNFYNILPYAFTLLFLILFLVFCVKYYSLKNEQSGQSLVMVPPIENISVESAEKILSAYNLNLTIKDIVYDSNTAEGFIISQSPYSANSVPANSEIEVLVSKGEENKDILMPNVTGLSLEEGLEVLKEYELKVRPASETYSETFDKNIIIEQKPKFNEKISAETDVSLTVSLGGKIIIVPNIIGFDYLYSYTYLESLGLIVISSRVPSTEYPAGTVVQINPSPGSRVKENSLVEIITATTEQLIQVPNVVKMNLAEAENILNADNINFEIIYVETDYSVQKGLVLGQVPESESYISQSSIIILYVGQ